MSGDGLRKTEECTRRWKENETKRGEILRFDSSHLIHADFQ